MSFRLEGLASKNSANARGDNAVTLSDAWLFIAGGRPPVQAPHERKRAQANGLTVVIDVLERDLVDWFRSQGNVVLRINDLCRFCMDTSVPREWEFAEDEKMHPDPSDPPTL